MKLLLASALMLCSPVYGQSFLPNGCWMPKNYINALQKSEYPNLRTAILSINITGKKSYIADYNHVYYPIKFSKLDYSKNMKYYSSLEDCKKLSFKNRDYFIKYDKSTLCLFLFYIKNQHLTKEVFTNKVFCNKIISADMLKYQKLVSNTFNVYDITQQFIEHGKITKCHTDIRTCNTINNVSIIGLIDNPGELINYSWENDSPILIHATGYINQTYTHLLLSIGKQDIKVYEKAFDIKFSKLIYTLIAK